jgi:hypothetical protein
MRFKKYATLLVAFTVCCGVCLPRRFTLPRHQRHLLRFNGAQTLEIRAAWIGNPNVELWLRGAKGVTRMPS